MSFQITKQVTLQEAVNRVSALVGFPAPLSATASTDPAVKQLILAINESGVELLGLYPWNEFIRSGSQTVNSADVVPPLRYAEYDLPEDFLMFVDQTQWNETTQLPGIGPINPQQWQQLQVRLADTLFQITWRVAGGKLQINNPGDTDQEFVFQYISQGWVQDGDTPTQFKNIATRNTDLLLVDYFLLVRLARAKWLEYKGFDNTAAMRDFLNSAESRFGQEKGAPILNLSGNHGYRYLGFINMPDTNYGV